MKVRVTLSIEIDPEVWDEEYGVEPIYQRFDVRQYVLTMVQGSAAADSGAIKSADLVLTGVSGR